MPKNGQRPRRGRPSPRQGTVEDEQAVHAQLDGLAVHGREYYPLTEPRVLAIVNAWREELGVESGAGR